MATPATPDWVTHLEEHGWAVVKGVVSPDRCQYYYNEMWSFLERVSPALDRNNRSTWVAANWPAVLHNGLMQNYAVGHEGFVWEARMEPGVIDAFAALWGTEELHVSFDGINLTRPGVSEEKTWQHTDQSGTVEGFRTAQGVLNILPNGPKDGGLIVLDKSHLRHQAYFEAYPDKKTPNNFIMVTGQLDFYKGCTEIKLCGDPGDLFLFDSRTIHYACGPTGDICRAAIYVCYLPAYQATHEQLAHKRDAFFHRRMTSHHPHQFRVFSVQPRKKAPSEEIASYVIPSTPPDIPDRGKRLAGVLPYY